MNICTFNQQHLSADGTQNTATTPSRPTLAAMLMKTLLIISAFNLIMSFSAKANMDCIYTSSKSAITVRFTSPCSGQYQSFLDSFVNQLTNKINRVDTSYKILVLINFEFLYYDFSGSPDYFTSLGVDTLREMNSNFINDYCYGRYGSTDQSRPNALDINATDDKKALKEIGVKIIYNIDYRNKIDWAEVEKLIQFAALDFNKIKATQQVDTVRHYSWYVTLPTLDTTIINQIIGRFQSQPIKTLETKTTKEKQIPYNPIFFSVIGLLTLVAVYKFRKKQSS